MEKPQRSSPMQKCKIQKTRRWDQTRLARFIFPLKISKVKKNAIEYPWPLKKSLSYPLRLPGVERCSPWQTRPDSTCVNHDWHNAWEIPIKRWVICENEDGRWGIWRWRYVNIVIHHPWFGWFSLAIFLMTGGCPWYAWYSHQQKNKPIWYFQDGLCWRCFLPEPSLRWPILWSPDSVKRLVFKSPFSNA